ncbi:HTH domain-containing protein [Brevundimonas sp. UBA7534]|uniref:HTH domain-containing protein n=1 Tax=Brevundimonas sp. UBA7534 TaxID=1946138 RepID=UPI0025B9B7C0|nr:HTH domain-containing protein [Brevundimonas sp. UBA7534]
MSRSERLFDLLNALRRRRRPVSGQELAEEMGVSLRTLYRDIASLQAQARPSRANRAWAMCCGPAFCCRR